MIGSHDSRTAVFVATANALAHRSGGVQVFTRELLEILAAGGFDLSIVEYVTDQRPTTRFKRKLRPRPYSDRVPPDLITRVVERQRETSSSWVFLNGVDLAAIAGELRAQIPPASSSIALFSFGLESVDYLHEARADRSLQTNRAALKLGRQLAAECTQRAYLDHVFCMAPFEAEIERWLGAKVVTSLPRTVALGTPLSWEPRGDRLGCVGTFDHPPNAEGLALFLAEFEKLAPKNCRFRVVGGPRAATQALVGRFRNVDYLGPLDEPALRSEASTWSCFVHPIFCYARGASTKLSVALSWQLPVATTAAGARGYEWLDGSAGSASTPRQLVEESLRLTNGDAARIALQRLQQATRSAPTVAEVGALIRRRLLHGRDI